MSEVYEVCQRLKAAGYGPDFLRCEMWLVYTGDKHGWKIAHWTEINRDPFLRAQMLAMPNASECMKFARERWPDMRIFIDSSSELGGTLDGYAALINGHVWCHTDPDQAARLALAAALEADNAK